MADIISKSPLDLRNTLLRIWKQLLEERGLTNVQLGKNTLEFILADGISELSAYSLKNAEYALNQIFVETADDKYILKHADALKIVKNPAEFASGKVRVRTDGTDILVTSGDELVSSSGVVFTANESGTFAHNDPLIIVASEAGTIGNLDAGDQLEWSASKTHALPFVTVDAGGITGGSDAEDTEDLRYRILQRRRLATIGMAPDTLIGIAEGSSGSIAKAFCYPALQSPGHTLIVCQGFFNEDSNWTRVISDSVLQTVATNIAARADAGANIEVVSVTEESTDLAFGIEIPYPISVGGSGGGWIDETPFPAPVSSGTFAIITVVASASAITVSADPLLGNGIGTPAVGDTIAVWDDTEMEFNTAKILTISTTGHAHTLTLDTAIPNVDTGQYVSPGAHNLEAYGEKVLSIFGEIGPGEATTDTQRLPRARRRPEVGEEFYPDINSKTLAKFIIAFDEIADGEVQDCTNEEPDVPASIGDPTATLKLQDLGIYPIAPGI